MVENLLSVTRVELMDGKARFTVEDDGCGIPPEKLGCRPGDNRYVINELGVGYRMLEE